LFGGSPLDPLSAKKKRTPTVVSGGKKKECAGLEKRMLL